MRKIPATMATQHPDNALNASFLGKRFFSTQDEIAECYYCFKELGIEEYMWDWEGKFVDEAVIDRLYQNYYDFFKAHPLGQEKFLTFRIPNIWEEPSHRLPRAFMNLIAAEHAARSAGMAHPPLFEVILPMTTRADQLCYLQEKFQKITAATAEIFESPSDLKMIEVIPLLEQVETMAQVDDILEPYLEYLEKDCHFQPEYLRLFIARSDPAMNAGLIPCMLAVKSALSSYHQFGEKRGIEIYPWVGGGSLPFRGGINPDNIEETLQEYRGTASLTVQSAFRYDYPEAQVRSAIERIKIELPLQRKNYRRLSLEEALWVKEFNEEAKKPFQSTIEAIAPVINLIASRMPNHRERVQHVGIFGYSRGIGKVKLPRAIKFTGALYSLGVPPEFIATGQVLKMAQEGGKLDLIKDLYQNLSRDLEHAGHYLNRENLDLLAEQDSAWNDVKESIRLIESILGISVGPDKTHHILHRNFTSNVFQKMRLDQDMSEDILRAAELRKSLG